MTTVYPGALDSWTNPLSTDPMTNHAENHSHAFDAIEAIEAELGINPAGASATVVARLDAIDTTISTHTHTALPPAGGSSGQILSKASGDDFDYAWISASGTGDMSTSTYDAAAIAEQLVGLTATQTLTNKTLTQPRLVLETSAAPTPTAEGEIWWESDADRMAVGDGATTKLFSDDSVVQNRANHTGQQTISTLSDFPSTVSQAEAEAGVATTDRMWTAERVKQAIDALGGGGGLANVVEDTTPQLGGMLDVNGNGLGDGTNLLLGFIEDPSAVNYVNIENQATGGGPIISAVGADTNIALQLRGKGTGPIQLSSEVNMGANNIVTTGTVDGRDVAADGTKLDGIESGATADQTGAEIKTAYEGEANTNAFTDAEQSKLAGIEASADVTDATNVDAAGAVMESDYDAQTILAAVSDNTPTAVTVGASNFVGRTAAGNVGALTAAEARTILNVEDGATADQTGAEIKTAYEGEADTNAFTDAEQTKLAGIESGATADQSDAEIKTAYENNADTNAFTDAEQSKLAGIEASADVTDAANVETAIEAITFSSVSGATGDEVMIVDATDGGLKAVLWENLPGSGGGISNVVEDTTPQLGGMLDVNGNGLGDGTNLLLGFVEDASAVNYVEIENQATGSGPAIRPVGTDANIDLNLESKGTGQVNVGATLQADLLHSLGNITLVGTVDGRDVAADGTKLDGIETNADVTDAANVETAIEAITFTSVAGATGDEFVIVDATDGGLKAVLWEDLPGGGGDMSASTYDPATIAEQLVGLTATQTLTNKTIDSTTNFVAANEVVGDVYNATGGTLTKGTPVYVSGYNVGNSLVEVTEADSDAAATMPAIGLVKADITNASAGRIVVSGPLTDVTTNSWSVGDELYVSGTAGTLTNVKPTGTGLIQKVGIVLRSHVSQGIIDIVGAGRSNALPNLANNNFWIGDGSGVAAENTAAQARTVLNVADGSTANPNAIDNVVEDTTPQLGGMLDVNGQALGDGTRELLTFIEDGTAVNHVRIGNAGTGVAPTIEAQGDDTNISLQINGKGTGVVNVASDINMGANNIVTSGNVDGRDVSVDGTKLDGIESGATADQSDAEIKTAYENNADTNAFTDAEQSKLSGIETGADVTDAANVETAIEAITFSSVAGATGDEVMIVDATDGGLKAVLWENLPGGGGGLNNVVEDTTPQLGGNLDMQSFWFLGSAGNRVLDVSDTASAVNYVEIYNNVTGSHPGIQALGSDAVNNLWLGGNGTGNHVVIDGSSDLRLQNAVPTIVDFDSNELLTWTKAASAVNYIDISNAATANDPTITATGDDASVDLGLATKGSGVINLLAATDITGNLTLSGTVDGRNVATDGTKLDGIEASADVTDATNVNAAGAVMETDYGAQQILQATSANTPVGLTVGASTVVGRRSTGNIVAVAYADLLADLDAANMADSANAGRKISVTSSAPSSPTTGDVWIDTT
jgi:hypothetical protein